MKTMLYSITHPDTSTLDPEWRLPTNEVQLSRPPLYFGAPSPLLASVLVSEEEEDDLSPIQRQALFGYATNRAIWSAIEALPEQEFRLLGLKSELVRIAKDQLVKYKLNLVKEQTSEQETLEVLDGMLEIPQSSYILTVEECERVEKIVHFITDSLRYESDN
ncbi:hypothetical protein EJ08DRAFT_141046 [Tothia fuscella]|uniref:Uncharacterized protein n=1 Tax=Tothia fuscella TaxID=1048955 RepID=A0A9P4U0U0_9PEZI|nr:hypothetical protein EJ08DRAFT_141046 [Tothia fuscella]